MMFSKIWTSFSTLSITVPTVDPNDSLLVAFGIAALAGPATAAQPIPIADAEAAIASPTKGFRNIRIPSR